MGLVFDTFVNEGLHIVVTVASCEDYPLVDVVAYASFAIVNTELIVGLAFPLPVVVNIGPHITDMLG